MSNVQYIRLGNFCAYIFYKVWWPEEREEKDQCKFSEECFRFLVVPFQALAIWAPARPCRGSSWAPSPGQACSPRGTARLGPPPCAHSPAGGTQILYWHTIPPKHTHTHTDILPFHTTLSYQPFPVTHRSSFVYLSTLLNSKSQFLISLNPTVQWNIHLALNCGTIYFIDLSPNC